MSDYCAPPYSGGIERYRDRSVCPFVCLSHGAAARHAGCLQLSHRRSPEMCGLWTRPRTDVDPPRFMPPSNCHRRGHIVSPPPGRYLVFVNFVSVFQFANSSVATSYTNTPREAILTCAQKSDMSQFLSTAGNQHVKKWKMEKLISKNGLAQTYR